MSLRLLIWIVNLVACLLVWSGWFCLVVSVITWFDHLCLIVFWSIVVWWSEFVFELLSHVVCSFCRLSFISLSRASCPTHRNHLVLISPVILHGPFLLLRTSFSSVCYLYPSATGSDHFFRPDKTSNDSSRCVKQANYGKIWRIWVFTSVSLEKHVLKCFT